MNKQITRRNFIAGAAAVAAGLIVTSCSSAATPKGGGGSSASGSTYMVPAKAGALLIGFSNSFAGNAFRTQMILELKEAVKGLSSDIKDLIITDANNSVDKQLSDVNDLVTKGVNILLIDAASETALNTAVERAQSQGVLVVSFDNAVSSERGIVVNCNQEEFGRVGGEWLAKQLKSGDTVITLDGAAGSPVNDSRLKGAKTALDAAGIKIVGSANTDWDQAKGQSAAADLLSAHPDIKGIYSQGGAASLGAINAMKQRGMKVLPISGEGYNGFLKEWKNLRDTAGFDSIAPCNPPSLAADALKIAVKAMRGEDPGHSPAVQLPVITSNNLDQYVRTDLPDAFFLPTGLSEATIKQNYQQ